MNAPDHFPVIREQTCAALFDVIPDGVMVCASDGTILYANPALIVLFGYSPDRLIGASVEVLLPETLRAAHVQAREASAHPHRTQAMADRLDIRGLRADGGLLSLSIRLGTLQTTTGALILAFVTDQSALRCQAAELHRLNRALTLVHRCNESLVRARDEAALLPGIAGHLVQIGGYPTIWLAEASEPGCFHLRPLAVSAHAPAHAPPVATPLVADALARGRPTRASPDPSSDDRTWIALPFPPDEGICGALLLATDQNPPFLAEEEQLLVELAEDLAYGIATLRGRIERTRQATLLQRHLDYDELTGLPNRRLFQARVDQLSAAIGASALGLLVLDLDRFTDVNDAYGHAAGDRLLLDVTERLRSAIRQGDTLARLGGDEFAILLTGLSDADAVNPVIDKIRTLLHAPLACADQPVWLTAAIGVYLPAEPGCPATTLVARAEAAMSAARAAGRNHVMRYDPSTHTDTCRRLSIERELQGALARGELAMHYQPLIDLASGRIAAVEALLRWSHPTLGCISPVEFIPIAEDTGLILPVGRWVLETACRQAAAWRAAGLPPIRMTVNLSVRQFRDPDLEATILAATDAAGLPPDALVLEVTESLLLDDVDATCQLMWRLKALQIGLALDDFGTGYSSLAYLKRLPLTTIKIDRTFIRDITSDPNDAAIAAAVIAMAGAMNLTVVAEGVETEAQLAFLRQHGCHEIQGYWFSPPIAATALTELLATGRRIAPRATTCPGLLIVDSEPNVIAALRRVLRQENVPIYAAQDGGEALELLASHPIGVILAEQRLPGMTGADFLSRARRLHPQTIRILLSGYYDLEALTQSVNAGEIYRYLTKPWDTMTLRETIRAAFRLFQSRETAMPETFRPATPLPSIEH